tara:strand:- start:7 stop:474 length:468 start_codon:yes stop_codon:yes gene_type:complete
MAFKMKAGKEGPMKKNFPSAFKKDDGKKKKSKADIELDSLLTPASQDTMEFKTGPGFIDYLKRNDFTSADIVKIIKNTDKNEKAKLKAEKGPMKKSMKDADKKRRKRLAGKRKALKSVAKGNYKNTLERAMDIKYGLNIGPESGANSKRKTKERK